MYPKNIELVVQMVAWNKTYDACFASQSLSNLHILLREEVSVGTAVLQRHAVASGADAVPCHRQCAVVVRQSGVFHHGHVPQEGVGISLRLENTHRVYLYTHRG